MNALVPEEIKKQLPPDALVPMINQKFDFEESTRQAHDLNWHADIPLIVLTAANAGEKTPRSLAFLAPRWEEIRQELQQDLVHRSPRGKQIIATKSDHLSTATTNRNWL